MSNVDLLAYCSRIWPEFVYSDCMWWGLWFSSKWWRIVPARGVWGAAAVPIACIAGIHGGCATVLWVAVRSGYA